MFCSSESGLLISKDYGTTTAALNSAVIGTIRAEPQRPERPKFQGETAGPEISVVNHGGVYTPLSPRGPVFVQSTACLRTDSCNCGHSRRFYEML